MNRTANQQIEDFRDLAGQIVREVAAPNAVPPGSGYGSSGPGIGEVEPHSFEAEDGTTLYQAFTELDSTESGACAM